GASPTELAQWSHDFAMGTAAPIDMTQTMVTSSEMPDDLVLRLWAEFLRGSGPTAAEKTNIASILRSGTPDAFMRARAAILGSPEAFAQFVFTSDPLVLQNGEWINGMMIAVDGRTPTSAEKSALLTQLATSTRDQVALGVLQTDEARAQIVQWLYMAQQ